MRLIRSSASSSSIGIGIGGSNSNSRGNSRGNRGSSRRKLFFITLSLSLLVPALAACSKDAVEAEGEERVLRIGMVYGSSNDSGYRQQYTDLFEITHPNIKVEFVSVVDMSKFNYSQSTPVFSVSDAFEDTKKVLTSDNPPDVMLLDSSMYQSLAKDNYLTQLDPLMQQDKFDTSDIVPTVLEGIKQLGDNNIYGLTPTYNSSVLFYNKDMFTEKNIEFPKDDMTWDEIFALAERMKSGDGKRYGFVFSRYQGGEPFYDMTGTYLQTLQLRMWDSLGEKMTVNTPAWEKAWTTFARLAGDKTIPGAPSSTANQTMISGPYNPTQGDKFMSGETAMVIGDYYYISQVIDVNKNAANIPNYKAIDWDIVTVPTFPETKGFGGNIYLNNIMAINAKAKNSDDAWEFIKFMNSEEWAKVKSRSSYEMVARKKFIQPKEGLNYNAAAFYLLKPAPLASSIIGESELYAKKPDIGKAQELGRTIFADVISGKKAAADGLKEWETKGNELLAQMANSPSSAGSTSNSVSAGEKTQ